MKSVLDAMPLYLLDDLLIAKKKKYFDSYENSLNQFRRESRREINVGHTKNLKST